MSAHFSQVTIVLPTLWTHDKCGQYIQTPTANTNYKVSISIVQRILLSKGNSKVKIIIPNLMVQGIKQCYVLVIRLNFYFCDDLI